MHVLRGHTRPLVLWAPVAAYMAGIFYVSSLPDVPLPRNVSDLSAHWIAYLGLAVLVTRAIAGGLPRGITPRTAATALVITVAYGMSDEIHQSFVPGRSAELRDVMADAAGAVIGTVVCWAWGIIASADAHTRGL